jgi:hypothetical protein
MPSIGGVTCTFVRGDAPNPKQRVMLWQVPGIDGYGAQTMGKGETEFHFSAVLYGTRSAVGSWATAIQDKQGKICVIVNDWGTTYSRCLICKISPPKYIPIKIPGSTSDARGEFIIEGVIV